MYNIDYRNTLAPVNNHHPLSDSTKAYPYLGRQLNLGDIGKMCIRVYSEKKLNQYDWSFIPNGTSDEKAKVEAIKLKSLNPLIFENPNAFFENHTFHYFFNLPNDYNWLTLDEWLAIPNKDSTELQNPNYSQRIKMAEVIEKILGSFISSEIEHLRESNRMFMDGERRAYPYLGRQLGFDDIGKQVLRVFPENLSNCNSDWSYIPSDASEKSAKFAARKLISITPMILEEFHSTLSNDDHWLTLDEWLAIPNKDSRELKNPNFSQRKKIGFRNLDFENNEGWINNNNFTETLNGPIFETVKTGRSYRFLSCNNKKFGKTNKILSEFVEKDPNWYQEKRDQLPENFKPKDHAYHRTQKQNISTKTETRDFNTSATDPRAVLGLDPNVQDLGIIKAKYRKLALLFHPDKSTLANTTEEFKIISSAYKKLLEELQGIQFTSCSSRSTSDEYSFTSYCYKNHVETLNKNLGESLPEVQKKWEYFVQELEKTLKVPGEDIEIFLRFERLHLKAKSQLHYIQILACIESLSFETLEISESSITTLESMMQQVEALLTQFDLRNALNSWPYETLSSYKKAFLRVMDKYIALAKTLAEIHVFLNQSQNATICKKKTRTFSLKNHLALTLGTLEALADFNKYFLNEKLSRKNNQKLPNFKDNEDKKSLDEKLQSDEKSQNASEHPTVNSEMESILLNESVDNEIEELKENIDKNLKYFHIPKTFM